MTVVTARSDIATILDQWLAVNSSRLENIFELERFGEWSDPETASLGFDLFGKFVVGRVTAWAQQEHTEWPFADVEVLDTMTETQLLYRAYQPLSADLLQAFLDALENHEKSNDPAPTALA